MLKCETATFLMITPNDALCGQGCVGSWTNQAKSYHDMYQLSTQADKRCVPTLVIGSMFPVSPEVLQTPIRIFYFLWLKYKAEGFVAMIYNKNWQLIRITLNILL